VLALRADASRRAAWVLSPPLDQWLALEAACPFFVPQAHRAFEQLQRQAPIDTGAALDPSTPCVTEPFSSI
jgi:hypothetical protein